MAKTKTSSSIEITRGSGNVFADLGFPDAEERKTKLRLAFLLNEAIKERSLTQTAAAGVLSLGQPKVSALLNYKLEGFSVERLMELLTALDRDVEILVKRKARTKSGGRITVVAA
ncbi:MAG: helix-turn-helix domain-containing protein [Micropepsaceae bacterium]